MSDPMKSPDRDAADEIARPCTCHPDDNPPVPCAQKYALTDCLRSELATLRRRVDEETHKHEATMAARDEAEEFAADVFYHVMGRSAEWSNLFGYPEALEDIRDALTLLRKSAAPLPPGRNEG